MSTVKRRTSGKRLTKKKHIQYHKDGTVWAKGQTIDGAATGYWEWFRKDGTPMRSGYFDDGKQVGQWTTYDKLGRVYKVTTMKPNPAAKSKADNKTAKNEIDDYLDKLPNDRQALLQKLRKAIHSAAPGVEECTSYGLPAFRLDGKVLVLFGAAANHCSFYPGSGTAVAALKDELTAYTTSKGAIHFDAKRTLPARLVQKIVKYRIAENAKERRAAKRTQKPAESGRRTRQPADIIRS